MNSLIMNYGSLVCVGAAAFTGYQFLSQEQKERIKRDIPQIGIPVALWFFKAYMSGQNIPALITRCTVFGGISIGALHFSLNENRTKTLMTIVATSIFIYDAWAELKNYRAHENCLDFFSGKTISYPQSNINCEISG